MLDSSGKRVYKETETHMKKSSNNKEMTFNEVHLNGYSVAIFSFIMCTINLFPTTGVSLRILARFKKSEEI